jgi:hypothetical protein
MTFRTIKHNITECDVECHYAECRGVFKHSFIATGFLFPNRFSDNLEVYLETEDSQFTKQTFLDLIEGKIPFKLIYINWFLISNSVSNQFVPGVNLLKLFWCNLLSRFVC